MINEPLIFLIGIDNALLPENFMIGQRILEIPFWYGMILNGDNLNVPSYRQILLEWIFRLWNKNSYGGNSEENEYKTKKVGEPYVLPYNCLCWVYKTLYIYIYL